MILLLLFQNELLASGTTQGTLLSVPQDPQNLPAGLADLIASDLICVQTPQCETLHTRAQSRLSLILLGTCEPICLSPCIVGVDGCVCDMNTTYISVSISNVPCLDPM